HTRSCDTRHPPSVPYPTLFRSRGPDREAMKASQFALITKRHGATRHPGSHKGCPYKVILFEIHEEIALSSQASSTNDAKPNRGRSEEHTSELQSRIELVCRPLL